MIDFDRLIEQHLRRDSWPKTPGRYYPSEIGGCMRKIWYSYKHPVEMDGDKVRVFHLGNMLHDFIAEVLRSEKTPEVELLDSEMPFRLNVGSDIVVSGRVDDILLIKAEGKRYLVEVKSTKWLDRTKEPNAIHEMQLQMYMHGLNIHNGLLLYLDKNTLRSRVFEMPYRPEVAQEALRRFQTLHEHITQGKLPMPEARLQDALKWQCSYCDYRERCENEKCFS
jgi:CRISPR-associated exonuclease Cas4